MKRIHIIILCFLATIFSCTKDKAITTNDGNAVLILRTQEIQQTWNFDKFIHTEKIGNITTVDTVRGVAGDYFLFSDSVKFVYSFWDGVADTVKYDIINESLISYGNDTFNIVGLTKTSFQFSHEVDTDSIKYKDEIYLYR